MEKEMDDRFGQVLTDPRFRTLRKSDKKVKVDQRFKKLLTGKAFKLKYSTDKRGKRSKQQNSEDFSQLYDLSESERDSDSEQIPKCDEESDLPIIDITLKKPKIPNARGNDSSEESDSSSSDSEESDSDESEEFDHKWGEWDRDVPQIETATKRLAVCNIDWDRINASDLFVLLNSFKPSDGSINSVKIFPSKLGLQRMKAEEEKGPIQFIKSPKDSTLLNNETINDNNYNNNNNNNNNNKVEVEDEEEEPQNSIRSTEQLRQYQMSRLQYFYAVIECDTEATANVLYTELDGMEYESSSATLDLRFIPNDMTFEDEGLQPKTECYSMPDFANYKAPQFINSALQQSKVMMTWDETDPKRRDVLERAFNKDNNDDLKAYLASSDSEDDEDDDQLSDNSSNVSELESKDSDKISKYKQLLNSLNETKDKDKDNDEENLEMEISWEPNLKDVAEDIVNKKERQKDISTFEENYIKMKQKRKELISKESEEFDKSFDMKETNLKHNNKNNRRKAGPEDPNLDLLLMDANESSNKKHFNYNNMIKDDINNKKRKDKPIDDDFKFNADDPRFTAVYTSHHFNVDPSDPHFKRTDAFNEIISRSSKKVKSNEKVDQQSNVNHNSVGNSWSQLVRTVKNKTQLKNNSNKPNKFDTNKFKR